jgi:hypothetical protein
VLGANAAIKAAFGTTHTIYAVGELGGAHASAGSDSETSSSSVSITISAADLASGGRLILGLFSGTPEGSFSGSLTVGYQGGTLASETFTTSTLFTNDVLVDTPFSALDFSGALDLTMTLAVTTPASGDGFSGGFIVGDPPAAGGILWEHLGSEALWHGPLRV